MLLWSRGWTQQEQSYRNQKSLLLKPSLLFMNCVRKRKLLVTVFLSTKWVQYFQHKWILGKFQCKKSVHKNRCSQEWWEQDWTALFFLLQTLPSITFLLWIYVGYLTPANLPFLILKIRWHQLQHIWDCGEEKDLKLLPHNPPHYTLSHAFHHIYKWAINFFSVWHQNNLFWNLNA